MDENCCGYSIVNDYNINYWCDFSLINKILIGTAIKQNKLKIYSLSTLTLKNVNHPFFFPLKAIILTMNLLKIKFN